MASGSMKVSLESLSENEIQEISYDGTEKTIPPLSLSDNLTKLAHLIDFGKGKAGQNDDSESPTKKTVEKPQHKAPPWDWLRTSLRSSLTEMNVLADCLTIAKDKRVMFLDQIQNDNPDGKAAYHLLCRKQALQNAAEILMKGVERLKGIQQDMQNKNSQTPEFHSELLQLRQNWRIKKSGDHILGDLSFKSAGSTFWQSGTFEVFKKTSGSGGGESIDLKIPPELQGSAHIQVSIHMTTPEDTVSKLEGMLAVPQKIPTSPGVKSKWQTKLETAQNVLFCKELYSQISREAFQLEANIPHMVVNNQVIVHLFPDFKMHIMFVHSNTEDKEADTMPPISDPVLQLALHQLLREQHFNTLHKEPPHPVTSSIGPTKKRRIAGPVASSVTELLNMERPDQLNILKRLVDIARHTVLRLRVVESVEHIARTISDPMLQIHTDNVSDETHSSLHANITAHGYDSIRSKFLLKIHEGKITAVNKTGVETNLSYDVHKVDDYINWQLTLYQIQAVHHLSKLAGWKVLGSSWSSNFSAADVFGTQPAILISTPDGSRAVAVKSNTVTGVEVYVSQSNSHQHLDERSASDLITDPKFSLVRSRFKKVDMIKMSGRNFNQKIELLLASQSTTICK